MASRGRLRQPNGPFNPSTLGSSASSPTSTPSITTSPVIEARSDSFSLIFGALSPLEHFSSTKPRILPSCASDLAQTTNTSAMGELVIHILVPDSRYPPCTFCARGRMPPGSEPASGSVRPKQPTHSPVASLGRYFLRCSSVP